GAEVSWSCTACGMEEVARKLDGLVEGAVQQDHERPRATLLLRSVPPNADVQIDGRKVGFTEMERSVFAGRHEIVVSRLSLAPEHMVVDVSGEQRLQITFTLGEKVKEAPPPPPPQVTHYVA